MSAALRLWIAVAVVTLIATIAAVDILTSGDVGFATDPTAQPTGESAEPCTEADGACLTWNDIRESETKSSVALELIEKHDCWTTDAPAEVTRPGHVVLTRPGRTFPEYLGYEYAMLAADQEFNGRDHGLTIHGFCR